MRLHYPRSGGVGAGGSHIRKRYICAAEGLKTGGMERTLDDTTGGIGSGANLTKRVILEYILKKWGLLERPRLKTWGLLERPKPTNGGLYSSKYSIWLNVGVPLPAAFRSNLNHCLAIIEVKTL